MCLCGLSYDFMNNDHSLSMVLCFWEPTCESGVSSEEWIELARKFL